jgi:hypothetical protein
MDEEEEPGQEEPRANVERIQPADKEKAIA